MILVILLVSSVAVGEVVSDFSNRCKQFFADPKGGISPPTVFDGQQYSQICQTLDSKKGYKYATHYDTKNKIPVYSAYVYDGRESLDRNCMWNIEPQVKWNLTVLKYRAFYLIFTNVFGIFIYLWSILILLLVVCCNVGILLPTYC